MPFNFFRLALDHLAVEHAITPGSDARRLAHLNRLIHRFATAAAAVDQRQRDEAEAQRLWEGWPAPTHSPPLSGGLLATTAMARVAESVKA